MGWEVDLYQSRDKEHISKISIYPITDEMTQENVVRSEEGGVERIPIIGIREPVFLKKVI